MGRQHQPEEHGIPAEQAVFSAYFWNSGSHFKTQNHHIPVVAGPWTDDGKAGRKGAQEVERPAAAESRRSRAPRCELGSSPPSRSQGRAPLLRQPTGPGSRGGKSELQLCVTPWGAGGAAWGGTTAQGAGGVAGTWCAAPAIKSAPGRRARSAGD